MNKRLEGFKFARHALGALLVVCLAMSTARAGTVVVTFDDISPPLSPNDEIPNGYGGINWITQPGVIDFFYYLDTFIGSPSPSPDGIAYPRNAFENGVPVSFYFLTPEVFDGSYIYAYADLGGGVPETVKFDLYLNGVLQHESDTLIGNSNWQFLASGYSGPVDQVAVVISNRFTTAFMDNITYSTTSTSPVPEPGSSALLVAAALAGIGVWARRCKPN